MNMNVAKRDPRCNSRAGAILFGKALNQLRNQSAANQVGTSTTKHDERHPGKIASSKGFAVPSLISDDDYSLPLRVDYSLPKTSTDCLSNPNLGLQERLRLPLTSFAFSDTGLVKIEDYSLPVRKSILPSDTCYKTEDYSLPVCGSNLPFKSTEGYSVPVCSSDTFASRLPESSNVQCDYDLPLLPSASKGSLSSESDNCDGHISDEGYETRESVEKELPESSEDKDQENGVCQDCEDLEKYHRSQTNKEKLCLPVYNPELLSTMKFSHKFIDSHCHLDYLFDRENFRGTFSDYRMKHKESFPANYEGCVAVFCEPKTFIKKNMWQKILSEDNVWAAFGCHPKRSKLYNDKHELSLLAALDHPKVRALGEIGLDYSKRNKSYKDVQHRVFRRQLQIARSKKLPLVIHCREAHEDGLKIMKELLPRDYKIHLHCFTDAWKYAKEWLDTFPNLFIGITNLVTFSSAQLVHQVVRNIPLDRLLLETDAPYFVPRGRLNDNELSHPGMALHVAAQVAALRGDLLENVVYQTRVNTYKVYGI